MHKALIYLSPSSQHENRCWVCGSEETHCRHLAKLIKSHLEHYPQVKTILAQKMPYTLTEKEKLEKVIEESNKYAEEFDGIKIHLALHTNAHDGNSRGNLLFHYAGNEHMKELARSYKQIFPELTRVEARFDLLELRKTVSDAIYFETYYHDNVHDARLIHSDMTGLAERICTGILQHVTFRG